MLMGLKKITLSFLFVLLFFSRFFAQSVGGITTGANTYCDTFNSGFISVTNYTGNVLYWMESTNGGASWTNNANTFNTQSYFNLKQSRCYRAVIQQGAFPPDTSTMSCITIYLPTVAGTISGGGSYCVSTGAGSLTLNGQVGNVLNWQYSTNGGTSWTSVTNTTSTLSYTNITQNTIYSAVVQNSSFCKKDTSSFATFSISPMTAGGSIGYTGNDTVCYAINSNTLALTGNIGNVNSWLASTDNGATWSVVSNTTNILANSGLTVTTLFSTEVQSGACPSVTTTPVKITVYAPNPVNAGNDTTINQGQSVTLNGIGLGSPSWSPITGLSTPYSYTTVATPDITTTYVLTVNDIYSCSNYDTVLVTVIPLVFEGTIATVFTPNGDGINDTWYIEGISSYPDNEVQVFNIYGNEVFSKKKYTGDWQGTYNGSPLPDGTYYYVLKVSESQKAIKGSLDILRNK